jgi:hypothetical protein
MASVTHTLPVPEASQEVWDFAAEQGVAEYLPAVLEMTRRVFPTARINVAVEDDPELSYNRSIVIRVNGSQMDLDQAKDDDQRWNCGLFAVCPATHVHVFDKVLELS